MSEEYQYCSTHKQGWRGHDPRCPWCRIKELEAKVEALQAKRNEAVDVANNYYAKIEELTAFIQGFLDKAEPLLPEKMCNKIRALLE